MIRKLARRLFWRIASSEVMLVRRPAWRLLRLFEKVTGQNKPPSSARTTPAYPEIDPADRAKLADIYQRTQERRTCAVSSLPSASPPDQPGVPPCQRSLVMLVPSVPKFDRNSSALRILCILRAMSHRFKQIHLIHQAMSENDPVYKKGFPDNVVCHHIPFGANGVEEFLDSEKPEVLFITELFDPAYIHECSELTSKVRTGLPGCHIVLDTMDCHWKKYVRKALLSGHSDDWAIAWRYLQLEQRLYPEADLLTVVTEEDGNDIALTIEGSAPHAVLPNCYVLCASIPRFEQTAGLCFVGPASVNHNLDAMRYLRDTIMPHISHQEPDARVHVIGAGWDTYLKEFHDTPFVFHGHAPDLDQALSRHRVFVCPLTYGAGLKGKLGSAASAGIPVVSTTIGCEGYPLTQDEECLISDDPEEFAGHCLALLRDPELWSSKRSQFRSLVERNYGMPALQKHLDHALGRLANSGVQVPTRAAAST